MKVIEGNVASPLGFSADGLHAGLRKENLILVGLFQKCQPASLGFIRPIKSLQRH